MRIVFGIVLLTVVIAALASIETTTAKQHATATIDPLGMTLIKTSLPKWKYDAY